MSKFIFAKIASIAALLSSSALLTGCETSAGRPELQRPDQTRVDKRHAKVKRIVPDPALSRDDARGGGSRNY